MRFMPGEHDASLDNGAAFKEFFGETHYTFDHKGVHFIVARQRVRSRRRASATSSSRGSRPTSRSSRRTRASSCSRTGRSSTSHPQWDWATRDGAKAIDLLMPYQNVTVFYGHIHQENHHMTGHIAHHSAKSLIFPLPAPVSQPKRDPVKWDPAQPYRGLGFREVEAEKPAKYEITEFR